MISIYTDGSSTGKIGKAGSAALLLYGNRGFLIAKPLTFDTGNNVAEMAAVYLGLQEVPHKEHVMIYTDSNNVIMWLTDNYKRNNPQIDMMYRKIKGIWKEKQLTVLFSWVRGHSGNKYNHIVDIAAKSARDGKIIREEISI